MVKIYLRKIVPIKIAFLIIGILISNFSIAQTDNEKQLPHSISPINSTYNLKWKKRNNASVLVVLSETAVEEVPGNFSDYHPSSEYKKGTNFKNSYVVYKGDQNSVELSGLRSGATYFASVYETNAAGILTNITNHVFAKKISSENNSPKNVLTPVQQNDQSLVAPTVEKPGLGNGASSSAFTTVCAPVSGITCTLSGTTSSGYIAGSSPCNANPFGTTNPWDGGSCSGYIAFSFSSPVKSVVIKMIAVNTISDKTTITQSGGSGGALTVSSPVCMSFSGLVLGPYTGPGSYGDVAAKVTSTGTYTTLTCTNTGCSSGWVAACPASVTTLPIELVSFTGECNMENVVNLKWKTISETNNDFFTVERSRDLENWEAIATIKGAGNSTQSNDYEFTDKQRFRETMYYRIKQTDFDREYKYSDPIGVSNCKLVAGSIDEVSFYPNPATNEITVNSNSDATLLEIYTSIGKLVMKKDLSYSENQFSISDLSNGIYYIKVSDNTGASKMTRLVVNH